MTNLTHATDQERADFDALCAAKTMQHAMAKLIQGGELTDEVSMIVLESERYWLALIDAAKGLSEDLNTAPAGAPFGDVMAPFDIAAVTPQTDAKSSPAPAQDAPAAPISAPTPHKAPAGPFPPTLRPASDTRTLCPRGPKLAGQ